MTSIRDPLDSVRYPDVTVKLTDEDGNVFNLIGLVRNAILENHGSIAASVFVNEATSTCGSYDELLRFIMRTVVVE